MDKKIFLILGSLFILISGIIYTIERLSEYIYWSAQIITGVYDTTNPVTIPLLDNPFIALFLLIGIAFIVVSLKKERLLS